MKFTEKLFEKMRDGTQKLLANGPMTATLAIQKTLQFGIVQPRSASPHVRPHPHPLRDINAAPQKAPTEPDDVIETGNTNNFVADLLEKLGVPHGHEGIKFRGAEFFSPEFAPPFAPSFEEDIEVTSDAPGRFIADSYSNQAGSRAYKLYIPSNYQGQALPLMVMLHGCTQSPDDFAAGTQMNAVAEEKQCFVVYPAQTQAANSSKCWNWFNAVDQQRDQGEPSIIAGITRQIMHTYNVDASKVYVAGLSAGGAMAIVMGTLYPELYAAVGVHSGLPFASAKDLPSALAAMRGGSAGKFAGRSGGAANARLNAIPIIVFHGDRDTTVHPSNGEKLIAQNTVNAPVQEAKSKMAGAAAGTASTLERGKVPNGHSYTRTIIHRHPGEKIAAEHWVIHGAAHAWSGGSKKGSYTDAKGPDASREMMRFFSTQAQTA